MEEKDANTNRRGIQVAGEEGYRACCRERGEKIARGDSGEGYN
jgi:hypothetical protein